MPIILFDGVCNFCNRTVNIIIKHDKSAKFQFAASQSIGGIGVLQKFNLNQTLAASVILIDNDKVYTKTDAVVQIAKHLKGWPRLFIGLKFIPKFIRIQTKKAESNTCKTIEMEKPIFQSPQIF